MTFITISLKEDLMLSCYLQTQFSLIYEIKTDDVYKDFYQDKYLFNLS